MKNQRNLKTWANAMWQTKYASAAPKNLGVRVVFWPCSVGDFLNGRPHFVFKTMSQFMSMHLKENENANQTLSLGYLTFIYIVE